MHNTIIGLINFAFFVLSVDLIPTGNPLESMNLKLQSPDEHSNHDGSQGSPLIDDDDDAASDGDGVTDKSSLDEGDKKDGSSKKRKRRVRVRLITLRLVSL